MQEREFNITPPRRPTAAQRAAIERKRKKRRAERRRNQIIFLCMCAVVLLALLFGIIKLAMFAFSALRAVELPEISMPSVSVQSQSTTSDVVYDDASYDVSDYVYDASDVRLVLVNTNLPIGDGYFVKTAVADDATGISLETEAAENYRAMASAAALDGISLVLTAGYHDADTQQALFDACQQEYIAQGYSTEEAHALAQSIVAEPSASEHLTGYGADILSADYLTSDIGYADTAAFAWLERYAAEYGFILRYPEDKQMITGRAYEPWHWRYVGIENAKAIVESGLTLEEFIEAGGVS